MFKRDIYIILIPIINTLVLLLKYFMGEEEFHFGIIRAIYMAVILLFFIFLFKLKKTDIFIYIFLFYLLLLIPLSSNYLASIDTYLKILLSFLMFPLASWFVNSADRFNNINITYLLCACLLVLSFFISQLFGIGTEAYSGSNILLIGGSEGVYLANLLSYTGIISIYLYTRRDTILYNKYILIILILLSTIVVMLIFRRSALLALFAGIGIYYMLTAHKALYTKYIMALAVLLIMLSPFYIERFNEVSEIRTMNEVVDPNYGRILDFTNSYNHITDLGTFNTLFGVELFNYRNYHNTDRNIHNDFGQILHGAGFIGLFLFILVFFNIFYSIKKKSQLFIRTKEKQSLFALSVALLVACMIISSANQLWSITSFSYVLFYLGSVNGYISSLNKDYFNGNE